MNKAIIKLCDINTIYENPSTLIFAAVNAYNAITVLYLYS